MKLIIDIDEKTYKAVKSGIYLKQDIYDALKAVQNGTPLDEYETIFTEGLLDGLKVSVKAEIEDYFSWGDISSTDQKAILNIIDKYTERSNNATDN